MIKSLLDRARALVARLHRPKPPVHQGASLTYARELHQLAREPGWLSPEEQDSAARVAAFDRRTDIYVHRMRRAERAASTELERIWLRTCAALHLDPIDIEWATLATGELITV